MVTKAIAAVDGVISAEGHDAKPHLVIVTYDSAVVDSQRILAAAKAQSVSAELIGL